MFKKGQILRVINDTTSNYHNAWIERGDYVRVLDVYPHHILVERCKAGKGGWHMRQCYPLSSWRLDLEVV